MPEELPATTSSNARDRLRQTMRARRRALAPAERARADARAQTHLLAHRWFVDASAVGLYRPFDGETDTAHIAERAQGHGKRVLYARVRRRGAPLEFVMPTGWRVKKRGLPVPIGPAEALTSGTVLVVPGVVFDAGGYRLGFGGGYYDRTLAERPVRSIGLAYAFQQVDAIARAPWDRRVGALATDAALVEFDTGELN